MELVIMAAGLGSRFGGLKQIEPIDKNGNFLIDYSIYDAIKCGFNKVVFIIKQENLNTFKGTIGKRIEKHIKTEYIFQELNTQSDIKIPNTRTKPLGTAHAVLSAKNSINSNFAVINADDYYGYDAISKIAAFLKTNTNKNKYALIGYNAKNTIFGNNPVKRGVCKCKLGKLKNITESLITQEDDRLFATPLLSDGSIKKEIPKDTIVSMNLFGFSKSFMNYLECEFNKFLNENKHNLETCEFFLPTVVSNLISENKIDVEIVSTSSTWLGITFKEDKEHVTKHLSSLIQKNIYPENLWQ